MRPRSPVRGHTLAELAVVLGLLAVGAALLAPAARGWADRSAVVSARETVVGLAAESRSRAVGRGRVGLHLTTEPGRAWWVGPDGEGRAVALEDDFGVRLVLSGGRDAVVLSWDALGLGRVASQTLRFERGAASATLVVSAHGRMRRR